MDILIGLAFIIKVCFKRFIKVYAYGILPYILLVSVLNIYHSIKNKDYKLNWFKSQGQISDSSC